MDSKHDLAEEIYLCLGIISEAQEWPKPKIYVEHEYLVRCLMPNPDGTYILYRPTEQKIVTVNLKNFRFFEYVYENYTNPKYNNTEFHLIKCIHTLLYHQLREEADYSVLLNTPVVNYETERGITPMLLRQSSTLLKF